MKWPALQWRGFCGAVLGKAVPAGSTDFLGGCGLWWPQSPRDAKTPATWGRGAPELSDGGLCLLLRGGMGEA